MAQRKSKPVPQHFVSTKPQRTQCRCGAEVLTCYVKGTPVRLDTAHVNLAAEAMVLCSGGRTYEIPVLGREHAIRRTVGMIREGLPRYGHIHPSHVCGTRWLTEFHDDRHIFGVPYVGSAPPF